MGAFYASIQIRTADRATVKAAAEAIAVKRSIHCLIGPEINGWIGVYPENDGQDQSVGQVIAEQLPADVLQLVVHDDDVLAYWLWRDQKLVDSYWSKPGYFGEHDSTDQESRSGNPEMFRAIIGDKAAKLAEVLDRATDHTFESERLRKVARLLGISNAVTAYDYLVSDERDGIKGWRKFEKVPPDPKSLKTAAAKAKSESSKSVREKLKKSGLLLYSHEWKGFLQLLKGFSIGDGFILGSIHPWQATAEVFELLRPNYVAQPLPFDRDQFAASVQGHLAVVGAGESFRIMDKSVSPWRQISEIRNEIRLSLAAISPNGEFIALHNMLTIVIRRLPTGDQVCEIPLKRSGPMAFHPTEKWLASGGDILSLIRVDGEPRVHHVHVGGNPPVVIGNIRGIEEPGCVGFSRDGRLFWCGTNIGLRIYEWEKLSSQSSRKPRWLVRLHDKLPSFWGKQVTAIAEEADGAGIVFGTFAGKLARFNLQTGELHKLADLPGGGRVETLLFSVDRQALAVGSDKETRKGPRSMPKHSRTWEIWSYYKLRDSEVLLGRAGTLEPVHADSSSS